MVEDGFEQEQLLIECHLDGDAAPFLSETGYYSFLESFDTLFTTGGISFVEGDSILQSYYPLVQASEIDFYLQDNDAVKHIPFFPYNSDSVEQGGTKAYVHKISLISRHAFPLVLKCEFHSEYSRASDYVRKLASRMGLRHDVEDTKDLFRWICPGWRVGQMLRHLAQHSVSVRGLGGYVYYVTYDGTLVFKSMDSFFEMSNNEERLEVNNIDLEVAEPVIKRKYMSTAFLGSNKVGTTRFDLDTDASVVRSFGYSDLVDKRGLILGLSDYVMQFGPSKDLAPVHSDHRTEYPHEELPALYRKVVGQYESTMITLTVKRNPFGRKLGDVVYLSFPGEPSNDCGIPYSGRYLITKVNTVGSTEFYQRLTLCRPGVNIMNRDNVK